MQYKINIANTDVDNMDTTNKIILALSKLKQKKASMLGQVKHKDALIKLAQLEVKLRIELMKQEIKMYKEMN